MTTQDGFEDFNDQQLIEQVINEKTLLVFKLGDVIQAYLAVGNNFAAMVNLVKNGNPENHLSAALAKKWVRNASLRIFNDPLRSFLEIVVNGCDSMLPPEHVVGKFGMGFFSIFSFLSHEETGGAVITLKTAYTIRDNTLFAYEITFSKTDADDITVAMRKIDPKILQNLPGTIITITPAKEDKVFSKKTLEKLWYFINYLDFHPYAKVILNTGGIYSRVTHHIGQGQLDQAVVVDLFPTLLQVYDHGTGIPVSTAFSKLLVPSSSSKAHRDSQRVTSDIQPARIVNFNGDYEKEHPHFLIAIQGVVVVDKQMKQLPKNTSDILISLPQVTQLTLARDEIMIIDENSLEAGYIKKIITKTIEDNLLNTTNHDTNLLLETLYQGLLEWEKQTAAQQIKGMFTSYFKAELDRIIHEHEHIIPAPIKFFTNLHAIIANKQKPLSINLVPLSDELACHNFGRLESFLKKILTQGDVKDKILKDIIQEACHGKLLAGVSVFFVKDRYLPPLDNDKFMISQLGLRSSLFVPESIVKNILKNRESQDTNKEITKKIATNITACVPNCEYAVCSESTQAKKSIITSIPTQEREPEAVRRFTENSFAPGLFISEFKKSFRLFDSKDLPILKAFFNKYYEFLSNSLSLNLFWSDKNADRCKTIISRAELFDVLLREFQNYSNDWNATLFSMINDDNSIIYDQSKDCFYVRTFTNLPDSRALEKILKNFEKLSLKELDTGASIQEKEAVIDLLLKTLKSTDEIFRLSFCSFMNMLFGAQLIHYGVYSYDASISNHGSRIFIGKEQLLPFKRPLTVEALETLFFSLVYHSYIERPGAAGLSYSWKESEDRFRTIQQHTQLQTSPIYLNLPGFSAERVPDIIEESLGFDLEWADNITKTLNFSIDNISVGKSISELVNWYALTQLDQKTEHKTTTGLSVDQKLQLMKLKESLLGLYHSYLSIPDSAFKRTYGTKENVVAIHPRQDVSPADVMKLLSLFAPKPALFKKLLGLQLDDFGFQTKIMLRADDLEHNTLYMPSTLSNTPISILATLQRIGIPGRVLHHILDKVMSPEELQFVGYLLLQENISDRLVNFFRNNKNSNNGTGDHLLTVIIERFVRERLDKEHLRAIYRQNRCQKTMNDRIKRIGDESVTSLIYEYINSSLQQKFLVNTTTTFIPENIKKTIELAPSFTLTQLLQAHTSFSKKSFHTALKQGDLKAIVPIIQQQSGKLDIGKIKQCIEVGSEKTALEGTIIESLQNSVDAIKWHILRTSTDFKSLCDIRMKSLIKKSSLQQLSQDSNRQESNWWESFKQTLTSLVTAENPKKSIEIEEKIPDEQQLMRSALSIVYKLEIMPEQTQKLDAHSNAKHIKLTIRDHVGMNSLATLLTDFILPDYSSKSLKHGNIGDMGNGIFKMYQRASEVSIITRSLETPAHAYCLYIKPMRSSDGRVQDLLLRVTDVSSLIPKSFFGTSIKILYQAQDHDKTMADLLSAKELLLNSVGCTRPILFTGASNQNMCLTVNFEEKNNTLTRLNNDNLNDKTLVYEYKEDARTLFTIYRRARPFLQSYLTTDGIPMRQLNTVLHEMNLLPVSFVPYLSNGYIVDLALGTYQPVQSRTRLNMDSSMTKKLRRALLEAFFIIGLQRGASDEQFLSNQITHFASTVSMFEQLRLSEKNDINFKEQLDQFLIHGKSSRLFTMRSFFDFYKPMSETYGNQSVYDYLEAGYQNNAIFKKLCDSKTKATEAAQETLKGWLNQAKQVQDIAVIEQCKNPDERNGLVQALHRNYNAKKEALCYEWATQRYALFNEWKDQLPKNMLITTVIIPWVIKKVATMNLDLKDIDEFLPKIQAIKSHAKNEAEQKAEAAWKKLDPADVRMIKNNLKKSLKIMLDSYCKAFFQMLNQNEVQNISADFYYGKHDERSGYFDPSTDEIYINLRYFNCTDQGMLFDCLMYNDITRLQTSRGYLDLYAPKVGRTPTLVHELEHAHRHNSHVGLNAHSDGINRDGELTSFESCANSFASHVLQQGLLSSWCDHLHAKMDNNASYALAKALWASDRILHDVELADKEWLLRTIGYCT